MYFLAKIISIYSTDRGLCYGDTILWLRARHKLSPTKICSKDIQIDHNLQNQIQNDLNGQNTTPKISLLSPTMLKSLGIKEYINSQILQFPSKPIEISDSGNFTDVKTKAFDLIMLQFTKNNTRTSRVGLVLSSQGKDDKFHKHCIGFEINKDSFIIRDSNCAEDGKEWITKDKTLIKNELASRIQQYLDIWNADVLSMQLVWYDPQSTYEKCCLIS